jgi:hypothetical protein
MKIASGVIVTNQLKPLAYNSGLYDEMIVGT